MWDKLPACQIVVRDSFQLVKSLKLSSVKVSRKHLLLLTTEPTVASLVITHISMQSKILIPLKSKENHAIFSPSPRFGERGPGGEG
jgi:hypothetical protein